MGTYMASCVVLVVEESGTLGVGVGVGKCELPAVVESGRLGVGEGRCELVAVESGRLGVDEGRCELVEVEEKSNGMDSLVVTGRNKNIGLLKFQMGNSKRA
ncbi:unnamed protein product [Vicia faba]|uniref:Uncharacterized protein n=1 Tax=Vicia faba TaxID=3906 RepID=A0AAV1A2E1_VICFA|nr:unnamed protein product [Vicia faba]